MSHDSQMRFFKIARDSFPDHFSASVIDIGSLDINGGPHSLIEPIRYVGVDIGEGRNVDVVSRGEDLEFADGEFDVAMSSECFEHNPQWEATLHNMIRMTRSGGLIVFTCASTGRGEHGTTRSDGGFSAPLATDQGWEYYKNVSESDVRNCLLGARIAQPFIKTYRPYEDLFLITLKKPYSEEDFIRLQKCASLVTDEFGNPRYAGRFLIRHIAITIFGDIGGIAYYKFATMLKKRLRINQT